MTEVVWVSHYPEGGPMHPGGYHVSARGNWDMGIIESIFDRTLWRPVRGRTFMHHERMEQVTGDGAIVVVPARHHASPDDLARLNFSAACWSWVLWILTGDEEGSFPTSDLTHPNQRVWWMSGRAERGGADRYLGSGWKRDTPDILRDMTADKPLDWYFAGQVTHGRRHDFARAARNMPKGQMVRTKGFTQGVAREDYMRGLASAKIAPCPSGPLSPDSFRFYEALEAGCLPLADDRSPVGGEGYWAALYGDDKPPVPYVREWAPSLVRHMRNLLTEWPGNANRAVSWWRRYRRSLAYALEDDLTTLGAEHAPDNGPSDHITVLMPTSPAPSHPDTSGIEETIASIRAHAELADAEVIIMCDGVRPEQSRRRADYEEYVRRLLHLTARMPNVLPIVHAKHLHQAQMTREAMALVRTACVLFVEHDTPLDPDIPWAHLTDAIDSGTVNVVRFHHEAAVLADHAHLMLDVDPVDVLGVPLLRTAQWSQRPHLASSAFYRHILATYFGSSVTMIEDVMHAVMEHHWIEYEEEGWQRFKLWMYSPPGNIRRSRHLDMRGDDPKLPMRYSYDGDQPEGTPSPTPRTGTR